MYERSKFTLTKSIDFQAIPDVTMAVFKKFLKLAITKTSNIFTDF